MNLGRGPFRIGVDIGGTFSDFVILDEDSGGFSVLKVPSTPRDPSLAILHGLQRLHELGIARGSVTERIPQPLQEIGWKRPQVTDGRRRNVVVDEPRRLLVALHAAGSLSRVSEEPVPAILTAIAKEP